MGRCVFDSAIGAGKGQPSDRQAQSFNEVAKVPLMLPANERRLRTSLMRSATENKVPHCVPGANGEGRVHSEHNVHVSFLRIR